MTKISLSGLACTLLITTLLGTTMPGSADEDGPKSPLAQQMDGIGKDVRSLRKMVNNPAQKDASLQLVKDMEARATKAKDFEPAKTKSIPAADKDQFLVDYRKQLDGLIADFGKLEAAVTAGDTAGASAMLDRLQADKRDGHKKFNAEDGGPGGHRPPPSAQAPAAPAQSGTTSS